VSRGEGSGEGVDVSGILHCKYSQQGLTEDYLFEPRIKKKARPSLPGGEMSR
jgi:hypothetical protein